MTGSLTAFAWAILFGSASALVEPSSASVIVIPMEEKGASTFYVTVEIEGTGAADFLVDTGAGYMTINEETLAELRGKELASYVKELEGILADGTRLVVPVYRLARINIGGVCLIENVEAAVFPGTTRGLLGLSALRKTAPFMFSTEPPSLRLSRCTEGAPKANVQAQASSPSPT